MSFEIVVSFWQPWWAIFRYHTNDIFVLLVGCRNVVGRRLLLSPSQYKLFWVWGQSLGHPKDAWTEAKFRLCLGTEPGKALSIHEEIGIPEVRVNQCIKVNMEALAPLSSGGQRERERIVGRRQCRQLRHERRERHIIQHLDLDLEALVHQEPMVCCRHICFWKPQL